MSLFTDLIADPAARRRYLVILKPYDPALGTTRTIYLSEDGFISAPSDTPASTYFEPRIDERFAFRFRRSLVNGARLGGRSTPNYGALLFSNADHGLDDWLTLGWDTREVEVLLGGDGFTLADCGRIFLGQAIGLAEDNGAMRLDLRDRAYLFEKPIQASKYAGTGGVNGGADLKDRGMPFAMGRCRNVEPVVEDRAGLKLRVGDGAGEDVDAMRVAGSALTKVGGAPAAGQYAVDTAAMRITLGSVPANGEVPTCDVKGDKRAGTWRTSVADILREIAITRGGLVDPDDLDVGSFAALNTACGATVGIWIPDGTQVQIAGVLDDLVNSIGAFWGFRRDGKLQVGRLEAPSGDPVAEFGPTEILSLRPSQMVLPIGRQTIGYARNWRVMSENEMAGIAWTNGFRDFAVQEYRLTAEATRAATLAKHPLARTERWATLIDQESDAIVVRDFLLERDGPTPQFFDVTVKAQPFVIDLASVVRLVDDAYGLAAGADFRVIDMDENSAASEVAMTVWRPLP